MKQQFKIGDKVVRLIIIDRESYYVTHFIDCMSPCDGYVIDTEIACPYDAPNYPIYRFECLCDGKHNVWVKENELASFDLYHDFQDKIKDRMK